MPSDPRALLLHGCVNRSLLMIMPRAARAGRPDVAAKPDRNGSVSARESVDELVSQWHKTWPRALHNVAASLGGLLRIIGGLGCSRFARTHLNPDLLEMLP